MPRFAALACALMLIMAPSAAADHAPTTVAGLLAHYRDLSIKAEQASERVLLLEQRIADADSEYNAIVAALPGLDTSVLPEADRADRLSARAAALRADTKELRAEYQELAVELPKRIREVEHVLASLPPEQLAFLRAEPPPVTQAIPVTVSHPAVDYALAQLGKPYVWGAEGPDAYDCSGLVQAAYATTGVQLPRVSIVQSSVGEAVERAELRAGDLVFYYQPVHHVAIAIDPYRVVHAATFGEPVKIDLVESVGPITVIRRVG